MITDTIIIGGYAEVLGITPTAEQINYWQILIGVNTNITGVNFPVVLANRILSNPVGVVTDASLAELQVKAKEYLTYEPQEEVLPVMANWGKPYLERITFNTDVLTGRSGKEQRSRLYTLPRVVFEFSFFAAYQQFQTFQNQVYGVQGKKLLIPLWNEMRRVGDYEDLNHIPYLHLGQNLLYSDAGNFELVHIVKSSTTGFFFSHQPRLPWSRSTWLIPVKLGSIRERVQFSMLNYSVAEGTIQATMDEYLPKHLSSLDMKTLEGLPLLDIEANRVSGLGVSLARPTGLVDFGGKVAAYDLRGFSETSRTCEFMGNRSTHSIRDFFIDRAGKHQAFYMPSFQNDLELVGGEPGGKGITIKASGFTRYMLYPVQLVRHLRVEFKSKPAIILKITSPIVEIANGLEYISLVGTLPGDFDASEVVRTSFITLTRFSSDTLEVNWINAENFKINTSFTDILNKI